MTNDQAFFNFNYCAIVGETNFPDITIGTYRRFKKIGKLTLGIREELTEIDKFDKTEEEKAKAKEEYLLEEFKGEFEPIDASFIDSVKNHEIKLKRGGEDVIVYLKDIFDLLEENKIIQ